MKLEIIALLLAFVLLFGCAQGQAKTKGPEGSAPGTSGGPEATGPSGAGASGASGGTPGGGTGGTGTPGGSGAVEAFTVLDSFSASDLTVTDPDPGAEFVFDEKQLQ